MTIEERKQELTKHSASTVRRNPKLFAEFVSLYKADGGNPRDCMGCNFASVFSRWIREIKSPFNIKNSETMADNTFTLKKAEQKILIPGSSYVITKNSPDEKVIEYLNQDGGKYKDARVKAWFIEIPAEPKKKKRAVKKVVKKEE